jgi:hypothetical protein
MTQQAANCIVLVPDPARHIAPSPDASSLKRPAKKTYRTHTQVKTVEYGADKTTPALTTPAEVSGRVRELLNKLKDASL